MGVWSRLRRTWRGEQHAAEIREELQFHLEMDMADGHDRREARLRFGNVRRIEEDTRAMGIVEWLDSCGQDVRYALRRIRTSPGAAVVAILSVAIGVGANAAMFSIVRGTLLAPLPYQDPDRLVILMERWPTLSGGRPLSKPNFHDWAAQNTVFNDIAAATWGDATISGAGRPAQVSGAFVTPSYFGLFGLGAALGRTFASDEVRPGHDRVVVISQRLWYSQFGSDPKVLGQRVRLDGDDYAVIGVMPPGSSVEFGSNLTEPDIWRPFSMDDGVSRAFHEVRLGIARLKPGVSRAAAQTELDTIAARLAQQYPDTNTGYSVIVEPFPRPVGLGFQASASLLFAAAGAVLLLACVNLANLTLARSAAHARDVAIRTALGARKRDLVRQYLTEQFLIALVSGVVGILAGYAILSTITRLLPTTGFGVAFPSDTIIRIDLPVWTFAFALSLLCGLACGLTPVLALDRQPLVSGVREGSGGSGLNRAHQRLQHMFVVAEVSLAFALLTSAGLLLQSFSMVASRVGSGFDAKNLVVGRLPMPERQFTTGTAVNSYLDRIRERVRALPGIQEVSFSDSEPGEGTAYGKKFQIVGQPDVPYVSRPLAGFKVVSASYFSAAGLHLIEGRTLEDRDRAGAPLVIVVNQAMVRTFFHGDDPLGRRLLMRLTPLDATPPDADLAWTVVGVVADEGVLPFDDRAPQPTMYVTREQHPRLDLALVVRTALEPARVAQSVREAIAAVNPDQSFDDVKTVAQLEREIVAADRLRSTLITAFAIVAVALAVLGIYGVMAHAVGRRTREMAIRTALGASTAALLALVLRQASALVTLGLGVGLTVALVSAKPLATVLYGISASDPRTLSAVAALVAVVALLAAYVPARRATKVDPLVALRCE